MEQRTARNRRLADQGLENRMDTINITLTSDERSALACAIEAALTATHKAVLGETTRYYDEDAGVQVTLDRVDPVVAHTSIMALEGVKSLYNALTELPKKQRPAMFGVAVTRTDGRGAEIVVEKPYAAFVGNMLALAFQHALVLAPDAEIAVGDDYPAGSDQHTVLLARIRDDRQLQRKVLKTMIERLT